MDFPAIHLPNPSGPGRMTLSSERDPMPAPSDLHERIRRILVERLFLEVEPDKLGGQESLTEAYGIDSVRLFDMVVGLEEDFGVQFEDSELKLADFDTVDRIAAKIAAKLGP